MYDLTAFNLKDMTMCGSALRQMGIEAACMEEVAHKIVHYLYDHLGDATGERTSSLVRFLITVPYRNLDDDLQDPTLIWGQFRRTW